MATNPVKALADCDSNVAAWAEPADEATFWEALVGPSEQRESARKMVRNLVGMLSPEANSSEDTPTAKGAFDLN